MSKTKFGVGALVTIIIVISIALIGSGERLSARGGVGKACYPNDTCDKLLTCWQIRDSKVCEKEIRPVLDPNARVCYLYRMSTDDDFTQRARSECFQPQNACLKAFAETMREPMVKIVSGCR